MIKGQEHKVLDHGFVRVVDVMGDDSAVVQAARVSYGDGTKSVREDEGLIRYLMRHWHTTPFEMCEIKFHVKLPIFVARQWIRHRTANTNEYSARYSEVKDEFYVPEPEQVRAQSKTNKQGRGEKLDAEASEEFLQGLRYINSESFYTYHSGLHELNVARETSRIVLPLNTYTEWYWKTDLHNLLHFCRLRADPHAQWEIRQYAEAILKIVEQWVPATYRAFVDYRLNAHTFSGPEMELLRRLINRPGESVVLQFKEGQLGLTNREMKEFAKALGTKCEITV